MRPQNKLLAKFRFVDKKFQKVCEQLKILSRRIEGVEVRYNRACAANALSFCYVLRLDLASLEGIQNMYYEYACCCAEKLEALQEEMIAAGLL